MQGASDVAPVVGWGRNRVEIKLVKFAVGRMRDGQGRNDLGWRGGSEWLHPGCTEQVQLVDGLDGESLA